MDTTRRLLTVSDLDYVSLRHGPGFERDVWAAANQYPLNPGGNRMILVRDAEKITRHDQLVAWLGRTRQLPGVHLVFVSNDHHPPHVGTRKNKLTEWAKLLRAPRGSLVKCSALSGQVAVDWTRRRAPGLDDDTAQYLLTRTGGDLNDTASVCDKLTLFTGAVGTATIDQLCEERPSLDLADHLLAGDKRLALMCVPDLSEQDMHALPALLESRLDLLASLHRLQIAGHGWRDASGINPYLARQYLPLARNYDPRRCTRARRVLAVAEDAVRSGARIGVFEGLIALW